MAGCIENNIPLIWVGGFVKICFWRKIRCTTEKSNTYSFYNSSDVNVVLGRIFYGSCIKIPLAMLVLNACNDRCRSEKPDQQQTCIHIVRYSRKIHYLIFLSMRFPLFFCSILSRNVIGKATRMSRVSILFYFYRKQRLRHSF